MIHTSADCMNELSAFALNGTGTYTHSTVLMRINVSRDCNREQVLANKTPEEAVAEMLLRLRWDDRIEGAKEKLERIVAFLWNAQFGGPQVSDIPSSIAPHTAAKK